MPPRPISRRSWKSPRGRPGTGAAEASPGVGASLTMLAGWSPWSWAAAEWTKARPSRQAASSVAMSGWRLRNSWRVGRRPGSRAGMDFSAAGGGGGASARGPAGAGEAGVVGLGLGGDGVVGAVEVGGVGTVAAGVGIVTRFHGRGGAGIHNPKLRTLRESLADGSRQSIERFFLGRQECPPHRGEADSRMGALGVIAGLPFVCGD